MTSQEDDEDEANDMNMQLEVRLAADYIIASLYRARKSRVCFA